MRGWLSMCIHSKKNPMKKTFFFFHSDLQWEEKEFFLSLFLFSYLFEWILFSILSNDLIKWGKWRVRVWWSAIMEAWLDWWQWRHEEKGERWEWDQMRKRESEVGAETRRELGESKSESKDQEWEKIIKILNTHATVTVHICTVIVAIMYLYTSLHPLMWVIFCLNCVKLVTFSILHIYAKDDGNARLL